MKVRNESLDFKMYAVVRRFPDLTGEGAWEIVGKPNSDIAEVEGNFHNYIMNKFDKGEVTYDECVRVQKANDSDDVDRIMAGGWEYSIVELETREDKPLGVDFAREHPEEAARMILTVHKGGGDVWNAWAVLVVATGEERAFELLCTAIMQSEGLEREAAASKAREILDEGKREALQRV